MLVVAATILSIGPHGGKPHFGRHWNLLSIFKSQFNTGFSTSGTIINWCSDIFRIFSSGCSSQTCKKSRPARPTVDGNFKNLEKFGENLNIQSGEITDWGSSVCPPWVNSSFQKRNFPILEI